MPTPRFPNGLEIRSQVSSSQYFPLDRRKLDFYEFPLIATGVLVRIIKENKDLVSFYVFHNFNNALASCSFPTALKYADLWPASKKDVKENYRPISILPNFLIKSFQNFSVVFVKVLT